MCNYLAAAVRTQYINPDAVNLYVNDTVGFITQLFQLIGC